MNIRCQNAKNKTCSKIKRCLMSAKYLLPSCLQIYNLEEFLAENMFIKDLFTMIKISLATKI
ncbi:hypothetical protein BpHYR1_005695 [Brachionus plicatilis]|uniref:Uncharacterized protein n=1 Tax=Brachionus plicatilis TaxID=10195 RepID=A0A3M7PYA5_BRAPC|nr:hypothetical protein BpHYR1_005695 [Brachionus plicatilis]